jgi:hypothetical protein
MSQVERSQVKRWSTLLDDERDAAELYSRLAPVETGERRQIFEELADIERRHATHWADKLQAAGIDVPVTGRPRLIGTAARCPPVWCCPSSNGVNASTLACTTRNPTLRRGWLPMNVATPARSPSLSTVPDPAHGSRSRAGSTGTAPTAPAACGPRSSASVTGWC